MKNCKLYGWLAVCVPALLAMPALSVLAHEDTATNSAEKTYTGIITWVDSQESLLTVKGFVSSKKFNAGNDCVYVLLDNRAGGLKDLRTGQKVKVDYQATNSVLIADRVELQPQIFEGQVKALNLTNQTLTVAVHWSDKTFQVSSNCAVALHNGKSGSLADVQIGEHVTVTYETPDNVLTACRIVQKSALYTGTLTAIDIPNRIVKTKTFFGSKKFNLADNCAIVMNGKTDGQLSDLKLNDRLVFSYDEVNGVNIANRIASAPEVVATNNVSSTYVTQPGTGY
ncbi:MAG TPA: hypothetical protein VGO57_11055 [Verrucomicrobiae bacterium]|jgi:hypothetical protein